MSGSRWSPANFGVNVPGSRGQTATGTNQATAFQLTQQVTVFSTVASGTGCSLPGSFASGTNPTIINRGANNLTIYPAPSDQIEDGSVGAGFTLAPNTSVQFTSFDAPAASSPRTWWESGGYTKGNLSGYLPLSGGTMTGQIVNLTAPTFLLGNGTLSGLPYQFQSALDFDPSAAGASGTTYRKSMFNTTLSYSGTTANVWEGLTSFVTVSGPGTATGEINGAHVYMQFNANAIINAAENYEASMQNAGSISGTHVSYLAAPHITSTGTVSGNLFGMKTQLQTDNATVGAISVYAAIDNEALSGAGSLPTFNYFIRNSDALGAISSLGGVVLGSLALPQTNQALRIIGADTSGSTFPVQFENHSGVHAFLMDDSGKVFFANQTATIDPSGNLTAVTVLGGSGLANTVQMLGQTTGNQPSIQTTGSDSVVGLDFKLAKGTTGRFRFFNSTSAEQFEVLSVASAVSFVKVTGAAAASSVLLDVGGTATGLNIGANIATGITIGQVGVAPFCPGGITAPTIDNTTAGLIVANTGSHLGFFGTSAIAKPTGVAVTAAGIHAALTSLGLIAP